VNPIANPPSGGRYSRTAALALLGWYLMVPPLNTYLNNPKSFRGWNTQGSYDTARECESAAAQWQQQMRHYRGCDTTSELASQRKNCVPFELWLEAYQCVETTDPRLLK
jgi:hypothetical protein